MCAPGLRSKKVGELGWELADLSYGGETQTDSELRVRTTYQGIRLILNGKISGR
jgi:hypothetical protein